MEINKITTTNLSLLRKILEGKYDDAFNQLNCNDIELDECVEIVDETVRKSTNKNKGKSKRPKNSEFYLNGDDKLMKDWLTRKTRIMRRNRIETAKLRKEERRNKEKIIKENEERLIQARESYDKWLKEIRNRNRRTSPKPSVPEIGNLQRIKIAEEAYKNWLKDKENLQIQKRLSEDFITKANNKETKVPKNNALSVIETKVRKDSIRRVKSNKLNDNDRLNRSKEESKAENDDEELQQIIRNLRKAKLKQIEKSKRRVDSGIIFNREKEKKSVVSPEKGEDLQWVIAIEEYGNKESIGKSKSDNRARKVDLIDHHHDNPFVDKTQKNPINIS